METTLIKFALLSVFYAGFFYVFYRGLADKRLSYGQKRAYLLITSILPVLLPIASFIETKEPVMQIVLPALVFTGDAQAGLTQTITEEVSGPGALFYLFFGISILFALLLLIQNLQIFIKAIRGERSKGEGVVIIRDERVKSPYSFWKLIFIGNDIEGDDVERVIMHEKAHINLKHSFDLLVVAIVRCVQWFNPFIYLLNKELYAVHEFQADFVVIKKLGGVEKYRELIIKQQFGYSPVIVNSIKKSLTFKRLKEMEKLEKSSGKRFVLPLAATATLLLVFLISATQIGSAQSGTTSSNNPQEKKITKSDLKTSQDEQIKKQEEIIKKQQEIIKKQQEQIKKQQEQLKPPTPPIETDKDVVPFAIVEQKPTFQGGDENAFTRWVFSQLIYPDEAKKQKIMGRVTVSFIVDTEGNVKDVKLLRPANEMLNAEAMRVIKSSPKWEPGKQKGKAVSVRYVFPVIFQLK